MNHLRATLTAKISSSINPDNPGRVFYRLRNAIDVAKLTRSPRFANLTCAGGDDLSWTEENPESTRPHSCSKRSSELQIAPTADDIGIMALSKFSVAGVKSKSKKRDTNLEM